MASLQIPQNGKAVKGRTSKTLPSVDLTAMVDLAFLLITFFMLTTSLAKMKAMDVAKPVPIATQMLYPASRTMTILLAKNDQVVCYMGEAGQTKMQMSKLEAVRDQILLNKLTVAQNHAVPKEKTMFVIIKPTNHSTYKNLVDALDEMNINQIESYTIDDKYFLDKEIDFLKSKGM